MKKLELTYVTEFFVSGGFKICLKQIQDDEEVIIVLDDSEIDDVIARLLETRKEAVRQRALDREGGNDLDLSKRSDSIL